MSRASLGSVTFSVEGIRNKRYCIVHDQDSLKTGLSLVGQMDFVKNGLEQDWLCYQVQACFSLSPVPIFCLF